MREEHIWVSISLPVEIRLLSTKDKMTKKQRKDAVDYLHRANQARGVTCLFMWEEDYHKMLEVKGDS